MVFLLLANSPETLKTTTSGTGDTGRPTVISVTKDGKWFRLDGQQRKLPEVFGALKGRKLDIQLSYPSAMQGGTLFDTLRSLQRGLPLANILLTVRK